MAVNDKGFIDASPRPRAEDRKDAHQATQAGTGGSLPDFGGREPAKAPPSVLDNWLTLEGFLYTPREYWEMLVALRLIEHVPNESELRTEWSRSNTVREQFLRGAANPEMTRQRLLETKFTNRRVGAITPPNDGRVWNLMTVTEWLLYPFRRRAVRITAAGTAFTGYVVGPRHVLTCAHSLPFYVNDNFIMPPNDEGSVYLGGLSPASPWSKMNLKVHLAYGTLVTAQGSKKPYSGGVEGADSWVSGLLTHSVEAIHLPMPTQSGTAFGIGPKWAQFDEHALSDMAILVMPKSFNLALDVLNIGWDNVLLWGAETENWKNAGFVRTGWGNYDYQVKHSCYFELDPPVADSGFAGFAFTGRTSRTEDTFTLDEAKNYGPSVVNKFAGTVYRSTNSDASPGDSGSSVVTLPGFSPPGTGVGVMAIWVGAESNAWLTPTSTPNKYEWDFKVRNYFVGGWGLYKLWLDARLKFPAWVTI